jgi:hypothetical protein
MGVKGQWVWGHKITIGRTTKMGGHEVETPWASTHGRRSSGASTSGCRWGFGMLVRAQSSEGVTGAGINVVAIHNHIETESPHCVLQLGCGRDNGSWRVSAALDTQKK